MQIDRINNINNGALEALLLIGICGPLIIWFHAFRESRVIIKMITFVIYCIVELWWFWYVWFLWLPVTITSVILIVGIDLRYGFRLEQYQHELKQVRTDG